MRLSLSLFLASLLVDDAHAHGAMQFPQPRNVFKSHYCPQCANGNGVCGAGNQWPADENNSVLLNGDYTTPLTELVAGGMIEIEVYLTAVHKGHFALELCANPGSTITDDCFVKLNRDPTDTRFSPYAATAPWAAIFPDNACASSLSQSSPMKVRFVIPSGSISEHAVLRWYWQSGNSCDSLPEASGSAPSEVRDWTVSISGKTCGAAITNMGRACGTDCPNAQCTNEQFRNCADVRIVSGNSNVVVTSSGKQTSSSNANSSGDSSSGHNGNNSGNSEQNDSSDNGNAQGQGGRPSEGSNAGEDNSPQHDVEVPPNAVDWSKEIKKCQRDIEGRKSSWDRLCRSLCEEVAVTGSAQQTWCLESGYTSLTKCVAKFYAKSCEED